MQWGPPPQRTISEASNGRSSTPAPRSAPRVYSFSAQATTRPGRVATIVEWVLRELYFQASNVERWSVSRVSVHDRVDVGAEPHRMDGGRLRQVSRTAAAAWRGSGRSSANGLPSRVTVNVSPRRTRSAVGA
jgi:hypothetical protein